MYGYVYKTTNLINGRIYIGKHHGGILPGYFGSGLLLKRAIKKYGRENFRLEVLSYGSNQLMLDGLEKKHIYEYRQVYGQSFLYNVADGGEGSPGVIRSQEERKKRSEAQKGKPVIHRTGCQCNFCKTKRGELTGSNNPMYKRVHPEKCPCASCCMKRGEQRGENNPNWGNKLSDVNKKKIGDANRRHAAEKRSMKKELVKV